MNKDSIMTALINEKDRLNKEHQRLIVKGHRGSALDVSWRLYGIDYAIRFVRSRASDGLVCMEEDKRKMMEQCPNGHKISCICSCGLGHRYCCSCSTYFTLEDIEFVSEQENKDK